MKKPKKSSQPKDKHDTSKPSKEVYPAIGEMLLHAQEFAAEQVAKQGQTGSTETPAPSSH